MCVRLGRRSGFTLIELLAVMAIIAILMGLLLPAISVVTRRARVVSTANLIQQLEGACSLFALDFGVRPPDGSYFYDENESNPLLRFKVMAHPFDAAMDLPRDKDGNLFDISGDAVVNTTSEALYYYLATPFRQTPTATDERQASRSVGPYFEVPVDYTDDQDDDGLPEIVDAWRVPIRYNDNNRRTNILNPANTGLGLPNEPYSWGWFMPPWNPLYYNKVPLTDPLTDAEMTYARPHKRNSVDIYSCGLDGVDDAGYNMRGAVPKDAQGRTFLKNYYIPGTTTPYIVVQNISGEDVDVINKSGDDINNYR